MFRVTITGTDNDVDPRDLIDLSSEFNFVEWGVLIGRGPTATPREVVRPRFPTWGWIRGFFESCLEAEHVVRLAMHVCLNPSRAAEDIALTLGSSPDGWDVFRRFGHRIQLNGYQPGVLRDAHVMGAVNASNASFILQCRGQEQLDSMVYDARYIGTCRCQVLFDPSQGNGMRPASWPLTRPRGVSLGFAGGIDPSNVREVLEDIGPRDEMWIDMETGVRTDNHLDLDKVRSVLVSARDVITRWGIAPSGRKCGDV
jgi:phosphoribosylanthranilate isomerase